MKHPTTFLNFQSLEQWISNSILNNYSSMENKHLIYNLKSEPEQQKVQILNLQSFNTMDEYTKAFLNILINAEFMSVLPKEDGIAVGFCMNNFYMTTLFKRNQKGVQKSRLSFDRKDYPQEGKPPDLKEIMDAIVSMVQTKVS